MLENKPLPPSGVNPSPFHLSTPTIPKQPWEAGKEVSVDWTVNMKTEIEPRVKQQIRN